MGKRVKKGRMPPGASWPVIVSTKVTKQSEGSAETAEEAVGTMTERRSCVHFDKFVKLDKLLKVIKSYQQIKCGECKEGVHVKRGSKAKVYNGKNGFSSSYDHKSAKKAIWVCLECGYHVCGDVGLPTGAQSHVVRHIRLTRHRLVIQCENPQLRWCFPCHSLFSFEKEEHGEKKDLLADVVELLKERSSNTSPASVETGYSWSGSGSITGEIKFEGFVFGRTVARDGYAVRGLYNLGNTCFFNSVLQNLLSLDQLREHFLKEDLTGYGGRLASSLKKLFAETKSQAGFFRSAINPGAFFSSVCSQSPHFRGYEQQDSHELLRCLLDGLSIEESSLRKKLGVSDSDDSSTHQKPTTLIDSVFGGEISSTVSCLECGHFSKVFEPFMDLSLPVPSKKLPSKKQQILSQAEKVLKNGTVNKDSEGGLAKPASDHISTVSIFETPSVMALHDKQVSEVKTQAESECDSFWSIMSEPDTSYNKTDVALQGSVGDATPSTQAKGVHQTLVGCTEMLTHDTDVSVKPESAPVKDDARATQSNEYTTVSGISAEIDEAQVSGYSYLGKSSSSVNRWTDEELPLMVADSQVLYMPYKDDISCDDNTVGESKGEASSSYVSSHHEQTEDHVDINHFLDDPGIPCNDKTVMAGEGEASSSFVSSGDHEQNKDYVDFSNFFDEPEISEGPFFKPSSEAEVSEACFMTASSDDKIVRADEGEVFSSFMSSGYEQNMGYVGYSSFFDEPEISEGPVFGQPSKAEVSQAGFMAVSSNDKTVRAGEGDGFSSFLRGDYEGNIDYGNSSSNFDEPEISQGPVFGPPCKAEAYEAYEDSFMDVSSNDKTFRAGEKKAFSSSFVSRYHEQYIDNDDFSSICNVSEISKGPVFGPPSKAGFMAVSCDSDPEVLDDLDSLVSVERCLAHFTKPEVLSEENAWHCENCSKNLKRQRLREKRKIKEGLGKGWVNENGDNSLNQSCMNLENGYNAAPITELPNCKEENNFIDDGVLGDSETKQAPVTLSSTETPILSGETISSQPANSDESERSEDEAVDSKEEVVKRAATKRVLVNKAPPVLTIHLKRFSQDARGRLSKLSGHVDFQEFIDLSQYMDTRLIEEQKPVYRLAGLVEHLGTMRGGHYVAYIRGGHKERRTSDMKEPDSSIWYHASDSYVRRASFEEVLRSEAYILFYERI